MKVLYSRQALSDLSDIANYYTTSASPAVAEAVARRLLDVIERIQRAPLSAPAWRNAPPSGRHPRSATHFESSTGFAATRSTFSIFATHPGGRSRD
ncbi:type II toxin-antitoxin system RelE/ParE family toxin [Bradyrhizobium sp. RDM12]